MKADACAESLYDENCRKFWSCVHKVSNNKAFSLVNTVGDVTGPQNVTNLWKEHFANLYHSSSGNNTNRLVLKRKSRHSHFVILLQC